MEVVGLATGRVTGPLSVEPIYEETKAGNPMMTLVVRADSGYTDRDGNFNSRPQFVAVKFFGGEAKRLLQYSLGMGDLIDISVTIGGREYQGKYYNDVMGESFRLLDKASGKAAPQSMPKVNMPDMPKPKRFDMPKDDDLPF